jgi:hypothetical protein
MESAEARWTDEIAERWVSGHLYYHERLDSVVRRFVHPLAASLVAERQIDGFFFVRYSLGGPHVRLRLRPVAGSRDHVREAMARTACRFLSLEPSTMSWSEEAIRRSNERILAGDPHEDDGSVHPDNSFAEMPFRPEVERYGGPDRFRASLEFFTLSSVAAVDFLDRVEGLPRSAQLGHASRLLLDQALGFAADERELTDLLRYGTDSWGELLPKVIEKADRVAGAQREVLGPLITDRVGAVRDLCSGAEPRSTPDHFLVLGADRLSVAAGSADRPARARVGGSQLHMTSSRLGLTNAEEVYLSRLLSLTLDELRGSGGPDLSRVRGVAPVSPAGAAGPVAALLSGALRALPRPSR